MNKPMMVHSTYTSHQGRFYIPTRMMPGIERYINKGVIPGDFLRNVICNNLKEACGHADDENLANLPAYVCYFYNEAPASCWGSEENMKVWADKGGLEGGD